MPTRQQILLVKRYLFNSRDPNVERFNETDASYYLYRFYTENDWDGMYLTRSSWIEDLDENKLEWEGYFDLYTRKHRLFKK